MEKQDRVHGRYFSPGLLILCSVLLLFSAFSLHAVSGPEEELTVLVQTESNQLLVGEPWTLLILVDHPKPEEVLIHPPRLPLILGLDTVRKGPKFLGETQEEGRFWTEVLYTFTSKRAASFVLGAFEVLIPGKTSYTAPLSLSSRYPGAFVSEGQFLWDKIPASLYADEAIEMLLLFKGRTIQSKPLIDFSVDEDMVIERLPLDPGDVDRGALLRLHLIPLGKTRALIPGIKITLDGILYTLEPIAVPVRIRTVSPSSVPIEASKETVQSKVQSTSPWPQIEPSSLLIHLPFISQQYSLLTTSSKALWGAGSYASALATVRAGERDLLAGPVIQELRENLETALGFSSGPKEAWAPIWAIVSIATVFLLGALYFRIRRQPSFTLLVPAFLLLAYLGIVHLEKLGWMGQGVRVILMESEAHGIPDSESAVLFRFSSGSFARQKTRSGSWAFVETPEGKAGWIASDRVFRY